MVSLTVVCAGDGFICADEMARECRQQLADFAPLTVLELDSRWPDEPFANFGGVREAVGDIAALEELVSDADVVLTHVAPITDSVITAGEKVRVIGCTRGGPVNVDLAAASARGIPVAFLPGRNSGAAAEFTIGLMLSVTRNIGTGAQSLARGEWDGRYFRSERTGPELCAATVGLVGFGAVGQRVCALLRAFGARVLVHDPLVDTQLIVEAGATIADLADLLAESDIVSLHARLTAGSRGIADDAFFAAMKPGAYLINSARGELVVTDALVAALQQGRLAGAGLDVFDPEPPPADHPLLRLPNVVATPHLAGSSRQVATQSAAAIVSAVGGYLRSGTLIHCANPDVLV